MTFKKTSEKCSLFVRVYRTSVNTWAKVSFYFRLQNPYWRGAPLFLYTIGLYLPGCSLDNVHDVSLLLWVGVLPARGYRRGIRPLQLLQERRSGEVPVLL